MSKQIRDYLLISFAVLFVVLTVIISLYASGYKINFTLPVKFNRLLIKTGMLVIDTTPSGAVIYLDEEVQKTSGWQLDGRDNITTPSKLKNMLPGEYNLRLEKDGYWPIKKRIRIDSGQTTFLENINLFKINLPLQIASSSLSELTISPNYKYLFLANDKKIINLKNNQEMVLDLESVSNWQWLKDGNRLLVNGLLINPEDGDKLTNYSQIIGQEANTWLWDETNDYLYYKNKDSLNRLEANQRSNTVMIDNENCLTYQLDDNKIFLITQNNNQTKLKEYSEQEKTLTTEVELPSTGDYHFISSNNQHWLSLYDTKNKTLRLFQFNRVSENNLSIEDIISWQWLSDYQLVYHNDFEIYLLDTKQNDTTLITRISEDIKKIIYNNNENYLIVTTNESLKVIDFRDDNITTLYKSAENEEIFSSALDKKNNTLYFTTQIGDQQGVYKMLVR